MTVRRVRTEMQLQRQAVSSVCFFQRFFAFLFVFQLPLSIFATCCAVGLCLAEEAVQRTRYVAGRKCLPGSALWAEAPTLPFPQGACGR